MNETPYDRTMAAIERANDAEREANERAERQMMRREPSDDAIRTRLEELRLVLRSESMSYGELAELQGLAPHIDRGDVELLEAAGVPEFPDA